MAQAGYESCSGCGRLFNKDSKYEMNLLIAHSCEEEKEGEEE